MIILQIQKPPDSALYRSPAVFLLVSFVSVQMTAYVERGQRRFSRYAQIFEDNDNDCLTYTITHQKQSRYDSPNPLYLRSFKKHPKVTVFLDSMSL